MVQVLLALHVLKDNMLKNQDLKSVNHVHLVKSNRMLDKIQKLRHVLYVQLVNISKHCFMQRECIAAVHVFLVSSTMNLGVIFVKHANREKLQQTTVHPLVLTVKQVLGRHLQQRHVDLVPWVER